MDAKVSVGKLEACTCGPKTRRGIQRRTGSGNEKVTAHRLSGVGLLFEDATQQGQCSATVTEGQRTSHACASTDNEQPSSNHADKSRILQGQPWRRGGLLCATSRLVCASDRLTCPLTKTGRICSFHQEDPQPERACRTHRERRHSFQWLIGTRCAHIQGRDSHLEASRV